MTPTRFEVLSTLATIIHTHTFDASGICRTPGRTEGESLATLYYDTQDESDSFGDQETTNQYRVFNPSHPERAILDADTDDNALFIIEADSQGFIYGSWMTPAELDALRQSIDDQLAEQDANEAETTA